MKAVILACTTMLENVEAAQKACGTAWPVIELDRIYHNEPADMRAHILQALAGLPEEADTVLVAMGFCGGSWQDVTCPKRVVIPRVADCVALSLVTAERFSPDLKQPGHMYLFGEGDSGFSIQAIHDDLYEKYDEDIAETVFGMYFENYHYLDVIDTGLYDCYDETYAERAQEQADLIDAELDYCEGSNILMEKLVSGSWDERFFIAEPGETIRQGAFFTMP